MKEITLGRTGITTTPIGLGCGGFSRLGIAQGLDHAAGIVSLAYSLGVRFFDTATAYGTQPAVGQGLRGIPRDSYTISTKFPYRPFAGPGAANPGIMSPQELEKTLDDSLRQLETDYIDVWHVHALMKDDIDICLDSLYPVMEKAREKGKVRFLGVTEQFGADTAHEMFPNVLPRELFDVIMVGLNILNPSARKYVLPAAVQSNVATLCMFAVRRALHDREQLITDLKRIKQNGQGGFSDPDPEILEFLLSSGEAATLAEAAYRFANHEPGITVTLTGTGNPDHLKTNIASLEAPELSDESMKKLEKLFGDVNCVSGQ